MKFRGMETLVIFVILSIPVIVISWRTLFSLQSHGFYRFLCWESIVLLFASNFMYWFTDAFCIRQIFSWILLIYSIYPLVSGSIQLKKAGNPNQTREEKALFEFEKTTELVDKGIYKYVRHPLYSSLLFLTWGILLKNVTEILILTALCSTAFLYLTARFDEKECLLYFGDKYQQYMTRTKMFVPFLI